ncbi:MAG: tripartite tricarboxylate transporter substrate binding protein [Betaproteobacteria bacterium]
MAIDRNLNRVVFCLKQYLLLIGLVVTSGLAWTQSSTDPSNFPQKPVKVIIPGGVGSGPDTLTRLITAKMAELWGQPVVVENIAGAGGNMGHDRVAKAGPDGYTLLVGMIGPMAINPSLQEGKLPFDPIKDFQPISMISRYPNILVVHPSLPMKNLNELLAYARNNPGRLRYGTPGSGTTPHLSAVMLSTMADIKLLEVPYKSSAQMTTDLIAGHIDMMFLNPGAVLQHVKSGALKAIAITSPTRQAYAADLPTMIESGLPNYEVSSWYGLFAPSTTPKSVVDKINSDLIKVIRTPEMMQNFSVRGDEAFTGTVEQAGNYLKSEVNKWNRVIKAGNIRIE